MVVKNHQFLRVSSAAEIRDFNLIGVSLTKPLIIVRSRVESGLHKRNFSISDIDTIVRSELVAEAILGGFGPPN